MDDHSEIKVGVDTGVLWAYHLDGEGGGREIDVATALTTTPTSGFQWVHFQFNAPAAASKLRTHNINPQIITALTASETRPRTLSLDDGYLITLRGVNSNPGSGPEDMISLRLWFSQHLILSARHSERPLMSVEDIRKRVDRGTGPNNTAQAIGMLAERIASRIGDVVNDIEDEVSGFETAMDETRINDASQSLGELRRQTAAIRRYLAPQRIALDTLLRDNTLIGKPERHELQTQSDLITRYIEDLDLIRERAMVLQGEIQNRVASEQNKRMYVLSIVAAVFLPLSFLTGLFGMNVAGLPGLEYPGAFIVVTVTMLLLAIALLVYMRWRKWL